MLGLREVVGFLCQEGKTESRVHVASLISKVEKCVAETTPTDPVYQVSGENSVLGINVYIELS